MLYVSSRIKDETPYMVEGNFSEPNTTLGLPPTSKFIAREARRQAGDVSFRDKKLAEIAFKDPELGRQLLGIAQDLARSVKQGKPIIDALVEMGLTVRQIDVSQSDAMALEAEFPALFDITALELIMEDNVQLEDQPLEPPAA